MLVRKKLDNSIIMMSIIMIGRIAVIMMIYYILSIYTYIYS